MMAYPLSQRLLFLSSYIYGKFAVLWQVRRPRWRFFFYEMKYSVVNALRLIFPQLNTRLYQGPATIETVDGKFHIRPGTHDAAITSPAFERRDRRHLQQVLREALAASHEVCFIDIGANIGAFAISMALRYPRLKVCAFEPAPENFRLLQDNIALNDLQNVTAYPFAISDQHGQIALDFQPSHPGDTRVLSGSCGPQVPTRRLQEVLPQLSAAARLVIKIDVEGHEPQVLRGIGDGLRGRAVTLMIEDMFHATELYAQLEQMGFSLVAKLSPYNSWWERT